MNHDEDDYPTLFPMPAVERPTRPMVKPLAGLKTPREVKSSKGLIAAMQERWNQFTEWSGFTKREIEVEIIPGRKCKVAIPQEAPPKIIIFRLFKNKQTKEYFTRPVDLWGGLIRFNATLCEDLALPIGRTTLWRLIYGGFVDAFRMAPMTTLIDLESLRQHLIATKIDGNKAPFWNKERVMLYREWEKITPEMLAKMEAEAQGGDGDE
ncbi:hypothetical protein [Prosthecobacter sp.]|jgi:hypothetical protein|uniref:hypothetical protein n=1 Tax=Prosthecobacter sp. TaxID=1965333 RepID=UPI0037C923B0